MRIKTWGKMIFDEIFIFEMYRSKNEHNHRRLADEISSADSSNKLC